MLSLLEKEDSSLTLRMTERTYRMTGNARLGQLSRFRDSPDAGIAVQVVPGCAGAYADLIENLDALIPEVSTGVL